MQDSEEIERQTGDSRTARSDKNCPHENLLSISVEGSVSDLHNPEIVTLEQEVLSSFIEKLKTDYPAGVKHIDEPRFLLRFLRARRYDLDKSSALFRNYVSWESTVGQRINICHARSMMEAGVVQLQGNRDPFGRTILFMQPAKFFPSETPPYVLLAAVLYLIDLATESDRTQLEGFTLMMDLGHIGFSNFSVQYVRSVFDTFVNRFPARVRTAILIDPPFVFNMVWAFVRPWLTPYQAAKVQVAKRSKLLKFMDKEQLPVNLGGCFDFNLQKFIQERCVAEGFDYADEHYKTIDIPNVSGSPIRESTGFDAPESESKKAVLKRQASRKT